MVPSTRNQDLRPQLHIDGIDGKSLKDIANLINDALLEPMSSYQPVNCSPPFKVHSEVPQLSDAIVYSMLLKVNPSKSSGPDEVPNWILKDYAEIVAMPVRIILNSSYLEQELPPIWKQANVTPLPRERPVTVVCKHLRLILLTATV